MEHPVTEGQTDSVRLSAHSDSTTRYYFELVPRGRQTSYTVAERHIPLAGATNFRDLGGYQARDARRVKWGTVFRSGNISGLTDQDLELFSQLDIELACDLRTDRELDRYPDRTSLQHLPLPPVFYALGVGARLLGFRRRVAYAARDVGSDPGKVRRPLGSESSRYCDGRITPH